MLKITTVRNENEAAATVYLCGRLTEEYVPELEKALSPEVAPSITLDMSNVHVDRKGVEFLCGVRSRVHIENAFCYVTLWIEQECRCGAWRKAHSEK